MPSHLRYPSNCQNEADQKLYRHLLQLKKPEIHLHFRGCLNPTLLHHMMLPIKKKPHFNNQGLLHRFETSTKKMILASDHVSRFIKQWSTNEDPEKLKQICQELWQFKQPYDFFMTYLMSSGLWEEAEELYPLSDHIVDYLLEHHIIYSEIIFSVSEYLLCGWSIKEIKKLLLYTQNKAREHQIYIHWIFDFVRNFPEKDALRRIETLLSHDIPGWVGITLGGKEEEYPARDFQKLYQIAWENGLHLGCHAGEHDGPRSIREAVELLGCERIGHGIQCHRDQATMDLLKSQNITLEVCPTSNLMTLAHQPLTTHPALTIFQHGIPMTIASDDPGLFQTSLTEELYLCMKVLGFSWENIIDTIKQGFEASFIYPSEKKNLSRSSHQFSAITLK